MVIRKITSEKQRHFASKKSKIVYAIVQKQTDANGKEKTIICKTFDSKDARNSCFNHLNNSEFGIADFEKIKD